MNCIVFHIPGEKAWERLEELEQAISDFPESLLVPLWKQEADELRKLLHYD